MRSRWLLAGLVALSLLATPGGTVAEQSNPCVGTMEEPAAGLTVISVQGARMTGPDRGKRRARLVAVGPRGGVRWVHSSGTDMGVVWSYDVDPLPNGNLFVTATRPRKTLFYELDPATGEPVWTEVLDLVDTHDADLLDEHRILIANMRNYNATTGQNDDRILIYNRTGDEVVWEWRFRDHGYPRDGGGRYDEDWTHVNDVDRIAPGRYLVSVRNFDQVVVVDRETGLVARRLGRDDAFGVMDQQHNPQYLEGETGAPTVLVADSGNDRVVEYERAATGWERTWAVGNESVFAWPRDADRLPDGNTLVVDSNNHRVVEVTPRGRVVWEVYSPWLVYDAERVRLGDEAGGPTIREQGAAGSYRLSGPGARPWDAERVERCAEHVRRVARGETTTPGAQNATASPTTDPAESPPTRYDPATATPPAGETSTGIPGPDALLAALALVVAALAVAAFARYADRR